MRTASNITKYTRSQIRRRMLAHVILSEAKNLAFWCTADTNEILRSAQDDAAYTSPYF